MNRLSVLLAMVTGHLRMALQGWSRVCSLYGSDDGFVTVLRVQKRATSIGTTPDPEIAVGGK